MAGRLVLTLILVFYTGSLAEGSDFDNFGVISELYTIEQEAGANIIACYASTCYARSFTGWIYNIDIQDPYNPQLEDQYDTNAALFALGPSNRYHFTAVQHPDNNIRWVLVANDGYSNWEIVHIADEGIGGNSGPAGIRAKSNHVYVCTAGQLSVYDVSNVFDISKIGDVRVTDWVWALEIGDTAAYVATTAGLTIIDISDPSQMEISSSLSLNDECRALAIDGTTAFVGTSGGKLFAIDVSDPQNPSVISSINLIGDLRDIAISNSHAYVVGLQTNPKVIDVRDPSNMEVVYAMSNDHNNGWGRSIEVREGYAFIVNSTPDFFVMGEMREEEEGSGGGSGGGGCLINSLK